jgi:hypothetical protein
MKEKEYYWGLRLPLLGVVKTFRFRTDVPLEKRSTMHLYPGDHQDFVEKGVLNISIHTRRDVWKMKILRFLGILTSKSSVIVIPDEYF